MRYVTIASALFVLLCGAATRAEAQQIIGPVCLADDLSDSVLKVYLKPQVGNELVLTGVDLLTGGSLSGTVLLTGGAATLGLTAHTPPFPSEDHAYFIGGNISLATASGQAKCEAVNTSGGCGTGETLNMFMVACPAGDVAADTSGARRGHGANAKNQ